MSEMKMERFSVPVQVHNVSSILIPLQLDPPPSAQTESLHSNPDSPDEASEDSFLLTVPPTTPGSHYLFSHPIDSIQRPFPKLDSFQIPYIREVGIKTSIDILSNFFSCPDYKLNALQFWFLDVIADCLWKLQDEFRFPERYQKIILEWILYVLDLIRDPQRNLSRKEFFQIFNEALVIADEKIQDGCDMIPSPDGLFSMVENAEEEEISFDTASSSVSWASSGGSFIAMDVDEEIEVFELPKLKEECFKKLVTNFVDVKEEEPQEIEILCGCEESVDFYQPDRRTPDRFKEEFSSSSSESDSDDSSLSDTRFTWKPSSEKLKEICAEYKLLDTDSTLAPVVASAMTLQSINPTKADWNDYLEDRKDMIRNIEKNILINSCVLSAVKEIVYDYFQFTVVKLALINNFNSITQNINTDWNIPKMLKEELKKPKDKKKKGKKKKGKKKDKKKKPKKPKKKTKKKDKKKKKGKKKDKKPKKKKLTKEEKAELARLKKEAERLAEEQRLAEENRRLLFPLKEATDDEFFKSIFDRWVRPKEKGKKGKKGKK